MSAPVCVCVCLCALSVCVCYVLYQLNTQGLMILRKRLDITELSLSDQVFADSLSEVHGDMATTHVMIQPLHLPHIANTMGIHFH